MKSYSSKEHRFHRALEPAWLSPPVMVAVMLMATLGLVPSAAPTQQAAPTAALDQLHLSLDEAAKGVLPKVVKWRRDLHAHPELGNQEVWTSAFVAEQLRAMGYEVSAGIARTGVLGLLRGGKPGPVVALRSDMDALPVSEETGLPFASKERGRFNGKEVGLMHACGHDFHMSMLLGAAEVLAGIRANLPGTVKVIFQPAEEGVPGEPGGAQVMVKEGVLENPKVDAVFGLHVGITPLEAGAITFRPKGLMAGGDTYSLIVKGRQTHGAMPWAGVDPIVVASQIVLGLQTIVSRQIDLTTAPAVVTVGTIEGGTRHNIVPDQVRMTGTIRTFDPQMRAQILARVKRTAESIAAAAGATAELKLEEGYPVTWNDPALTERMIPTLKRVAAGTFNTNAQPTTTSEDFSFYGQRVPALFFFLGAASKGSDPLAWAANHSPRFNPDEAALITGVRALASLAVDYLAAR